MRSSWSFCTGIKQTVLAVRAACLLLLCPAAAFATEYPAINFSQKDGLPSNTVYDVYHDKDGYIWFATSKGVSRYNGIKFENFTTTDGLPDNECFFFRKDKYGRLWIGTFNGMLVFYKDGVFHTAKNTPYLALPVKTGNTVDIFLEKDSSVTITYHHHSFVVNIKDTVARHYDLAAFYTHPDAPGSIKEVKDIEWAGHNTFKLVFAHKTFTVDAAGRPLASQDHPYIIRHLISREQKLHIGRYLYNTDYKPLLQLPEAITDVTYIFRVFFSGGNVFICTSKGVYINKELCFKNMSVTTVYRDRDSNFWIGTINQGIYKLDKDFLHSASVKDAYQSPVVFAHKADSILVLSTRNRNVYVYRKEHLVHAFDFNRKHGKEFHSLTWGNLVHQNSYFNFSENYVYTLKNLASGPVFCADIHKALLTTNNIISCKDYWYLKGRPLIQYLKNTGQTLTLRSFYEGVRIIFDSKEGPIYGAAPVWDKNELWFSTFQHVYAIRDTTVSLQPQFGSYTFRELSILNRFFIGYTMENTLLVADRYQGNTIRWDTGIRNNCIWEKFYRLNDSTLLITTNDYYRILRVFPARPGLEYDISIVENQFIPPLADYIYTDKKDIYFFKNETIFRFSLADLFRKDPPPRLVLHKIETLKRTIGATHTAELSFEESREVTIRCNTFSFSTNALQYEYALSYDEQGEDKWISSDDPNIRLFKIAPGTYTLKVRVKTFAGSYSRIVPLKIIVDPPWWLSRWFAAGMLLLLCAAVYGVIRYTIRRKNREKEREIRFIKSEYRSLNALMNPHFIFNSLNNVQGLINRQDNESASEYIRTISDLIRQNMSNIKNDLIPLEKEVVLVENYLKMEKLRFQEWLDYEIRIEAGVRLQSVTIPPLLIQPLVENAIKYSMKGAQRKNIKVVVHVYMAYRATCIDVTDNGPGLRRSGQDKGHESTAIRNIRKRLEQLALIRNTEIRFSIEEIFDQDHNVAGVRSSLVLLG